MGVVQLYLDHFHRPYPDLVNAVAALSDPRVTWDMGRKIRYWPNEHQRDPYAYVYTTNYTFSAPASFFAILEGLGFQRPVLWEFLRDTVERSVAVSEQEKQAFRAGPASHEKDVYESGSSRRSPLTSGLRLWNTSSRKHH
jgi:hypothetical protein